MAPSKAPSASALRPVPWSPTASFAKLPSNLPRSQANARIESRKGPSTKDDEKRLRAVAQDGEAVVDGQFG
jgi:hypothetical protein